MTQEPQATQRPRWLEMSGLPHLLRIPRLAIRTDNLGLGIAALFATLAFGTALDWVWTLRGGIREDAITVYQARGDGDYTDPPGNSGIFQVWRRHEQRAVTAVLTSCIPGKAFFDGTPVGRYLDRHSRPQFVSSLLEIGHGFCWLLSVHTVYAIVFFAGLLVIWGLAGGAICRIAAVQLARDELLTYRQGVEFAWRKLGPGFVAAPCIPLALALAVALLMALGGLLLRVFLIGDVVAGAAFFLALLGGFVLAGLLIGLAFSGHLYWPTIAAEGSDGFDAFSRGFAYVFTRPLKTVWYGIIALMVTAVCWLIANLGVRLALWLTRSVVGFGTAPFGWFKRQVGPEPSDTVRKLDLLWPSTPDGAWYHAPNWGHLGVFEYVSAVFIGFWVLFVIIALWSFLASLYFSSSTVAYFLLRRDVDGTDLEDLPLDDSEDADGGTPEPVPSGPTAPQGPQRPADAVEAP